MHRPEQTPKRRSSFTTVVVVLGVLTLGAGAWRLWFAGPGAASPTSIFDAVPESEPTLTPSPAGNPSPAPINTAFQGLTTFRGNATRTYYGEGPVPRHPKVLWEYPSSGGMCATSSSAGETKVWCGTGWTGQPNVVETKEGRIELRFGAYDTDVHVLNALNGRDVKAPFSTGDIIKGTVTSDPDGYPLIYTGSRDNYFRILATDRGRRLQELWKINATSAPEPTWNDDWDPSPLIVGDYALEGGENSWFYVIKLNRHYVGGKVAVDPEVRALFPGYDDQLFQALGDNDVSIENSPAFLDGVVYFANSGGLVQGWDISNVLRGGTRFERVFRFWTGDDTDASVVIDNEGYLYVASEIQRFNTRGEVVGQLVKLDPRKPKRPVVWKVKFPDLGPEGLGGMWATPALWKDAVFETTNTGVLLAVDRETGRVRWRLSFPPPTWTSPVVIDGVLIIGDCEGGLHALELRDDPLAKRPKELWSLQLQGCIESTPAVWKGMIFVGSRGGGKMYGIGDPL